MFNEAIVSGGGGREETLLWSSTQTSVGAFNATLSSDMDNFDYLKIVTNVEVMIIPVPSTFGNTQIHALYEIVVGVGRYIRDFSIPNKTSISFGNSVQVNASGGDNTRAVPKAIYGLR